MAITLKNASELLNATKTTTENGSSFKLGDDWEGFGAVFKTSSMTGTSPTYDAKLQHSHNGSDWFDLVTFTQQTSDSSEYKAITGDVMEFCRYVLTIGGTTPSATVELNLCYNDKSKRE